MARERSEFSGAMVASALLHVGIFAAALIAWPWDRKLPIGGAVPINIVANAPSTNLAPAEQGPEESPAATEEPVPDAPTPPAAPVPAPTPPTPQPVPKPPTPTPTPTPKPAPKPAAKPAPKPEKSLDLDALAASVAKSAGAQRSSAAKGPAKPATAQQARPDLGTGQAAAAIAGMGDDIQRRWNPTCDSEKARNVSLKVFVTLGAGGRVSAVDAAGSERSSDPVVQAAASRAISAVYAAAPFTSVPRQFYGERIQLNFKTSEACSR